MSNIEYVILLTIQRFSRYLGTNPTRKHYNTSDNNSVGAKLTTVFVDYTKELPLYYYTKLESQMYVNITKKIHLQITYVYNNHFLSLFIHDCCNFNNKFISMYTHGIVREQLSLFLKFLFISLNDPIIISLFSFLVNFMNCSYIFYMWLTVSIIFESPFGYQCIC